MLEIILYFITSACGCVTRSGAIDNNCNRADGKCRCKNGYDGRQCQECSDGHFNFPVCKGLCYIGVPKRVPYDLNCILLNATF